MLTPKPWNIQKMDWAPMLQMRVQDKFPTFTLTLLPVTVTSKLLSECNIFQYSTAQPWGIPSKP